MINIIGGGPVGSYLAYLLSKAGKKVEVYEEHTKIGVPLQCTGLVTSSINEVISLRKQFVVNKINKIKVFFPNKKSIIFELKKPNFVLDRVKFDQYLAERAKSLGVEYNLGHRFVGIDKGDLIFDCNGRTIKKEKGVIIGADGPLSHVAKATNLYKKRSFVSALQARISLNVDPNTVEVWLGEGLFGWVVPENSNIVRIGIAVKEHPNEHFREFLNKRAPKAKVRDYCSGLIPIYNPSIKTVGRNVFLVGDAATQVKATSYGGIVPGLLAAQELGKAIIKKKSYEKLWKKKIGKDLKYSLLIRKVLNRFSPKDYNSLFYLITPKVKKLIEKHDREFPSKLVIKLIFAQPRFLKFIFKFL